MNLYRRNWIASNPGLNGLICIQGLDAKCLDYIFVCILFCMALGIGRNSLNGIYLFSVKRFFLVVWGILCWRLNWVGYIRIRSTIRFLQQQPTKTVQ